MTPDQIKAKCDELIQAHEPLWKDSVLSNQMVWLATSLKRAVESLENLVNDSHTEILRRPMHNSVVNCLKEIGEGK